MELTTDLTTEKIARAFSSHRFDVALPHLADDVVWTLVGNKPLLGRKKVGDAFVATHTHMSLFRGTPDRSFGNFTS